MFVASNCPESFLLPCRVDGEIWHYRLKRDGRIFVVNQTVFENLNQIVEYYRSREFVRGISLRLPVNENEMHLVPGQLELAQGSYQELSQLEEKVRSFLPVLLFSLFKLDIL